MYCKKCGNELKQGADFCGKCGMQIEKEEQKTGSNKPRKEKHYVVIIMTVIILVLLVGIFGLIYYFLLQKETVNANKAFHNIAIDNNIVQEVIVGEGNIENKQENSEVQNEQKVETKISDITNYVTENTEAVDKYYNKITIPNGFKVLINEASTITEGIVIQDEKGNEFVWVPVGNVTIDNERNKKNCRTC